MNNVSKIQTGGDKKATSKVAATRANVAPNRMNTSTSPTSARKPVSKKSNPKTATQSAPAISEDQRREMIATAAYLRAEQRGFCGGDPNADWLAAEAEIAQRINDKR